MVTFWVKLFFSLMTIYIFLYSCSFVNYEFKSKNNFWGSFVFFVFTLGSIIFSNIICWLI